MSRHFDRRDTVRRNGARLSPMQRHALERLQLTVDEWTRPAIPARRSRTARSGFVRSEILRATSVTVLGGLAVLAVAGILFSACPGPGAGGPTVAPVAVWAPVSDDLRGQATRTALAHGVPPRLFAAVIQTESAWRPGARGRAGEIGLAQLRPETARRLGVNPHDTGDNLRGGAMLLRANYDRLGDWTRAIEAYNGRGPAARRYAQRVLRAWEASADAGGGEQ